MRLNASISVKKGEGYIFRLKKSEPEGFPNKFQLIFEEFNYYDGEDDQIIVVEDASIEGENIRFGLNSIKGVSEKSLQSLKDFRSSETPT